MYRSVKYTVNFWERREEGYTYQPLLNKDEKITSGGVTYTKRIMSFPKPNLLRLLVQHLPLSVTNAFV